jgi:hypothetical protein
MVYSKKRKQQRAHKRKARTHKRNARVVKRIMKGGAKICQMCGESNPDNAIDCQYCSALFPPNEVVDGYRTSLAEALFALYDEDGDGQISFPEFAALFANSPYSPLTGELLTDEIQIALTQGDFDNIPYFQEYFRTYDTGNNGYLDRDDFFAMVESWHDDFIYILMLNGNEAPNDGHSEESPIGEDMDLDSEEDELSQAIALSLSSSAAGGRPAVRQADVECVPNGVGPINENTRIVGDVNFKSILQHLKEYSPREMKEELGDDEADNRLDEIERAPACMEIHKHFLTMIRFNFFIDDLIRIAGGDVSRGINMDRTFDTLERLMKQGIDTYIDTQRSHPGLLGQIQYTKEGLLFALDYLLHHDGSRYPDDEQYGAKFYGLRLSYAEGSILNKPEYSMRRFVYLITKFLEKMNDMGKAGKMIIQGYVMNYLMLGVGGYGHTLKTFYEARSRDGRVRMAPETRGGPRHIYAARCVAGSYDIFVIALKTGITRPLTIFRSHPELNNPPICANIPDPDRSDSGSDDDLLSIAIADSLNATGAASVPLSEEDQLRIAMAESLNMPRSGAPVSRAPVSRAPVSAAPIRASQNDFKVQRQKLRDTIRNDSMTNFLSTNPDFTQEQYEMAEAQAINLADEEVPSPRPNIRGTQPVVDDSDEELRQAINMSLAGSNVPPAANALPPVPPAAPAVPPNHPENYPEGFVKPACFPWWDGTTKSTVEISKELGKYIAKYKTVREANANSVIPPSLPKFLEYICSEAETGDFRGSKAAFLQRIAAGLFATGGSDFSDANSESYAVAYVMDDPTSGVWNVVSERIGGRKKTQHSKNRKNKRTSMKKNKK